jgi:drug/metabolite transporter (DMT)-like permease
MRGVLYYSILLLSSFFLLGGINSIVGVDEDYRLIGWIYTVLGTITIAFIIKFQGWFFPKTENAELKQPTKILARFAHTARSILLLIVFYFLYLISFLVFYFTHFSFIHHVPWIRMEGDEALNGWCLFGDHEHNFGTETIDLIALYPLVMAIISIIAFNHTNRVVRLILFLLPIVGAIFFLFLHLSCIDSILERAQ